MQFNESEKKVFNNIQNAYGREYFDAAAESLTGFTRTFYKGMTKFNEFLKNKRNNWIAFGAVMLGVGLLPGGAGLIAGLGVAAVGAGCLFAALKINVKIIGKAMTSLVKDFADGSLISRYEREFGKNLTVHENWGLDSLKKKFNVVSNDNAAAVSPSTDLKNIQQLKI